MSGHVSPDASAVISTITPPRTRGMPYWYAAPRNGHISLFAEKTMKPIAEKNGALYVAGSSIGESATLSFFLFSAL